MSTDRSGFQFSWWWMMTEGCVRLMLSGGRAMLVGTCTLFVFVLGICVAGCGGGGLGAGTDTPPDVSPVSLPSSQAPPGSVALIGSLLKSGLQTPFSQLSVTAVQDGATSSTHPDDQGSFAMYVSRKSSLQVIVADETGRHLLIAGAVAPGDRVALVRVDPNVRTTAVALVGRARPDLAASARRTRDEVMRPVHEAIAKSLQLKVGEAVPADTGTTSRADAGPVGSIDTVADVGAAVQAVLPPWQQRNGLHPRFA